MVRGRASQGRWAQSNAGIVALHSCAPVVDEKFLTMPRKPYEPTEMAEVGIPVSLPSQQACFLCVPADE
jgi:hypothetical protein